MAVQRSGWGCRSIHDHFGANPASSQNPAHRGAADLKAAGDFGFADAGAMQFPNLSGMECGGNGPAQLFAILPGLNQASASPFPQNLSFKLSEDRQQSGHSSPSGSSQIQRLSQRHEPDAKMFQFLKG
jgi:hypothetical protein